MLGFKPAQSTVLSLTAMSRGANQRMNPDFAESAPKVADFADFWPIFPADEV